MPFPFVAIAISLAVSAATTAAAAALAPVQKIDRGGLNDLSIPKSSYGEIIPQCWGQLEMAGNLLWATALKEITETSGGKGASPKVTDRSYFANFAIVFAYTPNRPAEQFLRLKLNNKIVYDATNPDPEAIAATAEFSQYVRFYLGTESQQPDPLMQNAIPIQSYDYGLPHDPIERANALTALGLNPNLNHIPGYRYKVYAVFENLPLEDYNNALPSVKAEILFNSNNTAGTIVEDICTQVGITNFDTSLIDNISVPGFYLDRQVAATEAIRFLQQAYFFDILKSGKTLKFLPQTAPRSIVTIPLSDLAARESGQSRPDTFSLPKPADSDLPESVEINFLDKENSYDNGNVMARSQVAGSKKKESYSFPIVMTSAEAQAIADSLLHRFYLESITPELELPPKYAYLEVGDRLEINFYGEPLTLQITKIWMGANRLLKLNTKLVDAANLNNLTTTTTIATGGYNPPVVETPKPKANTNLQLLDINLISDNDSDNGIYASAYGSNSNWKGCTIYSSVDNSSYYSTKTTISKTGTIGTLVSNFNSASTNLIVHLDSGSVESISLNDLNAGINKLLVGNEIIQFQTQTKSGNNHHLSDLRRGLRGTESFRDAHTIGERVVLLTGTAASIIRLPGNTSDLNQTRYFKAPSTGQSLNAVTAVSLAIEGNSLKPYSPVNILASKDSLNNITLSWDRRDRHAGDATTYNNLPLSEVSEKWEIEILTSGGTPVRQLESYEPKIVYPTQYQITDFGANQSSISVRIYQISATVGRGYPGSATVTPTLIPVSVGDPIVTKVVPNVISPGDYIDIYGSGLAQIIGVGRGSQVFGDNLSVFDDTHIRCQFNNPAIASGYLWLYLTPLLLAQGVGEITTDEYITVINLSAYMKKVDYLVSASQLIDQAKISYPIGTATTFPRTLLLVDLGLNLAFTNATGNLIIPNGTTGNFPVGWGCVVSLTGTGSIAPQRAGGGLTGLIFGGGNTNNKLKTQGAIAITHEGNDIWRIVGRLSS